MNSDTEVVLRRILESVAVHHGRADQIYSYEGLLFFAREIHFDIPTDICLYDYLLLDSKRMSFVVFRGLLCFIET